MYNSHGSSIEGYPGMYSSTLVRGLIGGTQVTMYSNTSWGSGEGGGQQGATLVSRYVHQSRAQQGAIYRYVHQSGQGATQVCTQSRGLTWGYLGMYTGKGPNRVPYTKVCQLRGSIGVYLGMYTSQGAQQEISQMCTLVKWLNQWECTNVFILVQRLRRDVPN